MLERCAKVLILWSVFAGAGASSADEALDTLLQRRGEAFVAAMNDSGTRALETFAEEHLESRVARQGLSGRFVEAVRSDFTQMGPIEKHSMQIFEDGALLFVFCRRAISGTWQNFQFRVIANDEHRLKLMFVSIAIEPMARPVTPIQSEASLRWLRQAKLQIEKQQPFSGVTLVHRQASDIYVSIQGMADVARNEPIGRNTRFGMASGSKLFTAVAILQLAQAGKLSVGDLLIEHLPNFPDPEFAKRATIHQLLTHTAGAGNYWDDAYEKEWGEITELQQMLPFVLGHLGEAPPGEFSYSNSGFVLLGLVIEAVSGTSFYDYVEKHIFVPAGMVATGYPIRSEGAIAVPYDPEMEAGAVKPGSYVPVRLGARGTSAGGAATTADDMVRFAQALRRGVLLDRAHLDLMTQEHVPYSGKETWYGYGTIVERKRGILSYGHGGMAPGTQFEFKIFPELDTVMVVMSNYDTIAPHEIAVAIDDLIRNESPAGR